MATRSDYTKVILLSLSIIINAFAEESSETHSEPIAYPEECLRKCSPNLVEGTESKVSEVLNSGCYQLCLRRIKATHRQSFIKKRIRKDLTQNTVCPNSSPAQTEDWSPSVVNASFEQCEHTNHWFINLSWTPMNDPYEHWTGILVRFFVITNNSALTPRVNCLLYPKNQTFLKINVSSYGYRYPDAVYLNVRGFPYSRNEDVSKPRKFLPDFLNTPTSPSNFTTDNIPVCPNSSPAQTEDWSPLVVNVSFKQNENTDHWFINLSWTPMNDPYEHWTGILVRFFVITNNSALMPRVTCLLYPKNQTFLKINVSSYGYRYPDAIYLNVLGFPYSWKKDIAEPRRFLPDVLNTATSLPSFTTVKIKGPNRTTVYAVSISIGILIGIALVIGLLKCTVWRRRPFSLPGDFEYHAFILFNHEDRSWVTTKLLPLLEEKHHLKCCVHYRDFPPGKPFQETIAKTMYKSYKIIAVLSSNFLKSNYCNYELTLAKYRLLKNGDDSLIMIRIDEADSKKLPRELRKRNFIDYCSMLERPFWEEKLLKFLLDGGRDDFSNQSATIQQKFDGNSNSNNDSTIESANLGRNHFDRLDSTISNNTEISVVSQINEEEQIM